MEEEHVHLVEARPESVVVLEALAVDQTLVGEGEVVGTAKEVVDSIAEDGDVAVLWAAETVGCCEAVSAVEASEVADTEVPI